MNPNPSTIAILAVLDAAQALCEKALASSGDDWKIHVHAAQCLCDQAKMMLEQNAADQAQPR